MPISHTQNLHFQTTLIQRAKNTFSWYSNSLKDIHIRHKARAGPTCGSGLFFCSLGEIHGKRNPLFGFMASQSHILELISKSQTMGLNRIQCPKFYLPPVTPQIWTARTMQ